MVGQLNQQRFHIFDIFLKNSDKVGNYYTVAETKRSSQTLPDRSQPGTLPNHDPRAFGFVHFVARLHIEGFVKRREVHQRPVYPPLGR